MTDLILRPITIGELAKKTMGAMSKDELLEFIDG